MTKYILSNILTKIFLLTLWIVLKMLNLARNQSLLKESHRYDQTTFDKIFFAKTDNKKISVKKIKRVCENQVLPKSRFRSTLISEYPTQEQV